jgi:predicted amidohydrolase YtcJ
MQLQWAQPDNYTIDALLPYIGPERQGRLYPARSLLAADAAIAGASDWNVSTFNPFEAIAISMSRKNPRQPQRGTLAPDQALTLSEMLTAYTVNAARMLGREKDVGSLERGKTADIVVLDRQLGESSSADDVLATKVAYTFASGKMLIGPAADPQ